MLYTSRGTVTTCLLTLMLHIAWGYIRLKNLRETDSHEVGTPTGARTAADNVSFF